jgi:hypothetical protein
MSNADIKHFRTSEEFDTYVDSLIKPWWFTTIVTHHTWKPTVSQWRGYSSMLSMYNFYRYVNGWDRFPHVFIAPDGIWIMNKLTERGTHANAANPVSIGIEVVGDYDKIKWQEPIHTYAIDAHVTLMEWGKIPAERILPHRLYNSDKTCPGTAIDMVVLRKQCTIALQEKQNVTYKVIVDVANVRQGPSINYDIAGKLPRDTTFVSSVRKVDENNQYIAEMNTWRHILRGDINGQSISGLGFVHESLIKEV